MLNPTRHHEECRGTILCRNDVISLVVGWDHLDQRWSTVLLWSSHLHTIPVHHFLHFEDVKRDVSATCHHLLSRLIPHIRLVELPGDVTMSRIYVVSDWAHFLGCCIQLLLQQRANIEWIAVIICACLCLGHQNSRHCLCSGSWARFSLVLEVIDICRLSICRHTGTPPQVFAHDGRVEVSVTAIWGVCIFVGLMLFLITWHSQVGIRLYWAVSYAT